MHGDRLAEAWRGNERHKDGFARPGGHFAYQEAPEVILLGSSHPLPNRVRSPRESREESRFSLSMLDHQMHNTKDPTSGLVLI